jgi:hypothetical protein
VSVHFGVGRETLSQQLTRIEASRPARRDTSGVVIIDDALRNMLAGQPVPAFRGLTVTRFLAEHRPALLSARWSSGAWMASDQPSLTHSPALSDCDAVAERFERLPRGSARGMGDDIGTLAEFCRDNARVEAARVESARRRSQGLRTHRVFLDDIALPHGTAPDLPETFDAEITAAVEAAKARYRSAVDWDDIPDADDGVAVAGLVALFIVLAMVAVGLVWLGIHLLSFAWSAA